MPSNGGLYYIIAPVIAGVTCVIAIVLLLYRHVWNYVIFGAEFVAFLAWIVLLAMFPTYPLEKNQGMAAFAVGSGFVLWAETAFVVVVAPLTYGVYSTILKKCVSQKSAFELAGSLLNMHRIHPRRLNSTREPLEDITTRREWRARKLKVVMSVNRYLWGLGNYGL